MWRLFLKAYNAYCWFWFPLYRKLEVASLGILITDPTVLPPVLFSEELLRGEIQGKRVLDIGTGCGIIALYAKRKGASHVLGIDINARAVSNAQVNLINNFVKANGIEFRHGDLYECVKEKFDIIVSNPPFLKLIPRQANDYKFCGGDILERILKDAKKYLRAEGEVRILNPKSEMASLKKLASTFGYVMETFDHTPSKDTAFLRLLLRLSINPKVSMYVFRPTLNQAA